MKLFKLANLEEGKTNLDTILSLGWKVRETGRRYGWYVKLELPMAFNRNYLCYETFLKTRGRCRPIFYLERWTSSLTNKTHVTRLLVWNPLDRHGDLAKLSIGLDGEAV